MEKGPEGLVGRSVDAQHEGMEQTPCGEYVGEPGSEGRGEPGRFFSYQLGRLLPA